MKFTGDARGGNLPSSFLIRELLPAANKLGVRHVREAENRESIRRNCVPIMVDPKLLALAIDDQGIDRGMAVNILATIILDAHRQQVANTWGNRGVRFHAIRTRWSGGCPPVG